MKLQSHLLLLSASDLVGHLNCRHLTHLEVEAANGRIKRPHFDSPNLQLLFERGDAHEQRYLEHLQETGASLVHIQDGGITNAQFEQTVAAMRSGAEVIVQGVLQNGEWRGRTDTLQRIERFVRWLVIRGR